MWPSWRARPCGLAFHSENPTGNISSLFVDDVTLLACTTGGGGPSAPKTKSQEQVYLEGTVTNSDTERGIEGAQVFILKAGTQRHRRRRR